MPFKGTRMEPSKKTLTKTLDPTPGTLEAFQEPLNGFR